MTLRPESQAGFLMLQWLGVLVPGAFRKEVATWGGRRAGMSDHGMLRSASAETLAAIDRAASQPTPVRSIRERLDDEAVTFQPGETLTWPSAEAMLRGDPPTPTAEFSARCSVVPSRRAPRSSARTRRLARSRWARATTRSGA